MASEESFVVLVHHRGSIKRKTRSGLKFTHKDPLCIVVNPTTSYDDLVRSVLTKLGLEGAKRVKKFFYRIPVTVLQDTVKYDCFTIGSDEDLQVMFLCRRQFPEVMTPELLAKLVDVVSSSGGSNRNTTTMATAAGSSSRPAVASSSVPVYEPAVQPVASPSFAVDLNDGVGDVVGSFDILPNALQGVPPDGVGDGLLGDAEEDDVERKVIGSLGALTKSLLKPAAVHCVLLNLARRRSVKVRMQLNAGFAFLEFAARRLHANQQASVNMQVSRFEECNEVFEVHEIPSGTCIIHG
ncbi:hypothetical protein Ahy_B05g075671 [Arachis hypogaea]|uniref:Mutator sub-class protein n=1 Tax=Arachis hypogaea TaxID=3818 RepID=A0A444Z1Q6_ARAHY|nr:hypothetical protein Ahy_B05g075671 [Arachis hypogaea]